MARLQTGELVRTGLGDKFERQVAHGAKQAEPHPRAAPVQLDDGVAGQRPQDVVGGGVSDHDSCGVRGEGSAEDADATKGGALGRPESVDPGLRERAQ